VSQDHAELEQRIKEALLLIDTVESGLLVKKSEAAQGVRVMCQGLRAILTQGPAERTRRLNKIIKVMENDRAT
jgi:hypothetical protein